MTNAGPEQGTYALVNVQCPRFVLDTKNDVGELTKVIPNGNLPLSIDGAVVAYPYIGSQSQQVHHREIPLPPASSSSAHIYFLHSGM